MLILSSRCTLYQSFYHSYLYGLLTRVLRVQTVRHHRCCRLGRVA